MLYTIVSKTEGCRPTHILHLKLVSAVLKQVVCSQCLALVAGKESLNAQRSVKTHLLQAVNACSFLGRQPDGYLPLPCARDPVYTKVATLFCVNLEHTDELP